MNIMKTQKTLNMQNKARKSYVRKKDIILQLNGVFSEIFDQDSFFLK